MEPSRLVAVSMLLLFAVAAATRAAEPRSPFRPLTITLPAIPTTQVSVRDFGAVGDGKANDSAALSAAMADCESRGGGTVYFPPGTYTVASVRLRSNVRLLLHDDATIRGAARGYDPPERNEFDEYQDDAHSYFRNAVLWGEKIENFAIEGGHIDGGGAKQHSLSDGEGDKIISIHSARNLSFTNIRHREGAHIVYLLNHCENVIIDNVSVKHSRDALNLVNCRKVNVSRCQFSGCQDDTIALKSDYALGQKLSTEDVYVWDCYLESHASALQFGSETIGDIRRCSFWDIKIGSAGRAGIGITCNDGGTIEDIHFRDISIRRAANPIFMVVTRRLRATEVNNEPGEIRDITFRNIASSEVVGRGEDGPFASSISGLPESPIRNVVMEKLRFTYKGGESITDSSAHPPYKTDHQPRALGARPASGLYVRHVQDLTLRDVTIDYETTNLKPVMVFDDVRDVLLENVTAPHPPAAEPIRLHRAAEVELRNALGTTAMVHASIDMPKPNRFNLRWQWAPLLLLVVGLAIALRRMRNGNTAN